MAKIFITKKLQNLEIILAQNKHIFLAISCAISDIHCGIPSLKNGIPLVIVDLSGLKINAK